MKLTKPQQAALTQLENLGGAVPVSEWVTGSGRYVTPKAIPPGAARLERHHPNLPRSAALIFELRPRVTAVVCVV